MSKLRIDFEERKLLSSVERANNTGLRRSGAYIRKTAQNAVYRSKKASQAGSPPHTRRGLLRRSILFAVDKGRKTVFIGPAKSIIGTAISAHEFGGMYRRRKYPKRPLMGPSLLKAAPMLPKFWENSLKN